MVKVLSHEKVDNNWVRVELEYSSGHKCRELVSIATLSHVHGKKKFNLQAALQQLAAELSKPFERRRKSDGSAICGVTET